METLVKRITPALAGEYLRCNEGNRKVRSTVVDYLSGVIKRGEWILTHQGIAFDINGNLVDGQHRLMAVVDAGISVDMLVTTGLNPDSFKVVDNGAQRTSSELTGIDSRSASVCTTFVKCARNYRGRISPDQVMSIYSSRFGRCVDDVIKAVPKNIANITTAPMRAAAAYHLYKSGSRYAVDQLYHLSQGNFESLSGPSRSYMKRILCGSPTSNYHGGSKQSKVFDIGIFIFNESNFDKVRIVDIKHGERLELRDVAESLL